MRKVLVALGLVSAFTLGAFLRPVADAAVTATLTNPVDYTSANWRSVCLYNRDTPTGNYRGEITWEPWDSGNGQRAASLSSSRSTATLPAAYQTFVNNWITFARADFPAFN